MHHGLMMLNRDLMKSPGILISGAFSRPRSSDRGSREEFGLVGGPGLATFEGVVEAGEGGLVYRQNQENPHHQEQGTQQEQRNREKLEAKDLPEIAGIPHHRPALAHRIRRPDPRIFRHDEKRHRQSDGSDDARNHEQKHAEEDRDADQNHGNQGLHESVARFESVEDDLQLRVASHAPEVEEVAVLPDGEGAEDDDADVHAASDALEDADQQGDGKRMQPGAAEGAKPLAVKF